MRRTILMLLGCLAFLLGIGLGHRLHLNSLWLWLALLNLVLLRRYKWLLAISVIASGLTLGLWRGNWYASKLTIYGPLWRHKVNLIVQANDDGIYTAHSQLSFTATNAQTTAGQALAGSLVVNGFGVNSVMQGDWLMVSGTLSPGLGAEQGRLSFAKLQLIKHQPSLIAGLRRKFTAGVLSAIPEPEASFAMGLLIGQRATLPNYVKQDLLMVGLTHIIAVSGYNLTIILQASRRLLAGHSKRLATGMSLGLLVSFLLIAGSSASIVRAAIVSVLSIITVYYGRSIPPLLLLSLAASLTALARPAYVWHDASWYLSFLAFFGVMIVAPIMAARCAERWRGSIIFNVALESICAEIMSLPYILHNFGQMSLVGLPANVLIAIFVPLAMLLSVIAGTAGLLFHGLSSWLAIPANWLLTYMLEVAHLLANVPHVFIQNLSFSTAQMIGCYVMAGLLITALWHKTNSLKYVKLTDESTKEQN